MFRAPRLISIAVALVLTIAEVNAAHARRCHRPCCRPCCQQHDSCGCYGEDWTCLLTKIYEIGPNDEVYYADYYEGGCEVPPQAVYAETLDYGDNPNQICDNYECIPTSRKGKSHEADHLPHFTDKVFPGFAPPLEPDFPVHWSAGVTQIAERFEKLEFTEEGRTYKARVFDLRLDTSGNKMIHVAFEIGHFPSGANPVQIQFGPEKVKRCAGLHAYSVKYRGRTMLFLTDREGY